MEKLREQLMVHAQRAALVAAISRSEFHTHDNLAELTALAQSAGAVVVDKLQQKIDKPFPATYIGRGKAEHLAARVKKYNANCVIFDNDLSPAQIRELEDIVKVKVLDRSELILDIFATRAQTRQAKLQGELAQLEYTYPRLTRMWGHLDTVTGAAGGAGAVGAIGVRGTGEKQLEIDRRLVSKRITELERELEQIDNRRIREIEARSGMFKVCLVGYTNAGKSTLMNALTGASVYVEDMLFATLDTRTKKWRLGGNQMVLLSDTVGFVKNLPHHLVASFKATLEEALNADLLLHVVDISSRDAHEQMQNARTVLEEIGCKDKAQMILLNKSDMPAGGNQLELLSTLYPDALCISARTGMNLDVLSTRVLEIFKGKDARLQIKCGIGNGRLQSFLMANGTIHSTDYIDGTAVIDVTIGRNHLPRINRLLPQSVTKVKS